MTPHRPERPTEAATPLHPWDLAPTEARQVQADLASRLILRGPAPTRGLIAGIDCTPDPDGRTLLAVVVLVDLASGETVEVVSARAPATFPYVPGLLSFREGPAVLAALARLRHQPRILLFDGQGIAHPRGFGLASHLGLWLDRPSIGCAKSLLCGDGPAPAPLAGAFTRLRHRGRVVGAIVRTRDHVNPVYVSPGHRIGLTGAMRLVLAATRGYRLPEPTRLAHHWATRLRRGEATPVEFPAPGEPDRLALRPTATSGHPRGGTHRGRRQKGST